MQKSFIQEFLLRNEEFLLLNDETEQRLIDELSVIPDEYAVQLENFPFKSPKKAKQIATFFGKRAVEWFYLEDSTEGFFKKYFSGFKMSFKRKKKKDVRTMCREYNTNKLFEMANDPSIAEKIRQHNRKVEIGLKAGLEIGKDLAKDSKKLQDSFYRVDD